MAGRRKYDDGCAVAHGLDLVGERWALLVVRELLLGPKRFTDLRAGLPGASPDVLAQRLRQLQENGIVRHRRLPPPVSAQVYELTDWGMRLEPVVTGLGRWAGASPTLSPDAPIGTDALVLSMRALFDPEAAGDLQITAGLRLGAEEFRVTVAHGTVDLARGPGERPDVNIEGTTAAFAPVLRGARPLAEAVAAGDLRLTGDPAAAERLLALFPAPVPASPATGAG